MDEQRDTSLDDTNLDKEAWSHDLQQHFQRSFRFFSTFNPSSGLWPLPRCWGSGLDLSDCLERAFFGVFRGWCIDLEYTAFID